MGWFSSSKCPVDEKMRAWIEYRMYWLANEFGLETWWSCDAVIPTDTYFPDRYDGSEHSIVQMFDRVCAYMGVDPEIVALRLFRNEREVDLGKGTAIHTEGTTALGLYTNDDKQIVMIEAGGISDPVALVATMAHELGHVRLLGEERLFREEKDNEQLTDLSTVFFGFGVFSANSALIFEQWKKGDSSGWSSGKRGYLTEAAFSYALALWSYVRRDTAWFSHLRPNVRKLVKQGLRFLEKNPPEWFDKRRKRVSAPEA
jgi:hypothetical protein